MIIPASTMFSSTAISIHLINVLVIVISALHKKGQETTVEILGLKCFPTLSATVLNTLKINTNILMSKTFFN